MDAYHEVLVKLYEATGGKDNKSVDFIDLVKKAGLFGNYNNIFQRLNEEGWIAEDVKADFVRITQWGVAEAKKSQTPVTDEDRAAAISANACLSAAKNLVEVLEDFTKDRSDANLKKVAAKFDEVEKAVKLIKA